MTSIQSRSIQSANESSGTNVVPLRTGNLKNGESFDWVGMTCDDFRANERDKRLQLFEGGVEGVGNASYLKWHYSKSVVPGHGPVVRMLGTHARGTGSAPGRWACPHLARCRREFKRAAVLSETTPAAWYNTNC